jgi:hypothetical protein
MQPEVRYLIPCWKEPTMSGNGPSAHEIVYATKAKEGHGYPLWQQPLFIFAAMTNMHGRCQFLVELRLEELEKETVIAMTDVFDFDAANDPLRVFPISIMMKAAKFPRPGAYQLYLVSNGQDLAKATVHAR